MKNITWGRRLTRSQAEGYSAIELMMVVGLIGVVGSMAVFQLGQAQPVLKGDGGMRVVLAQLNTARELSISQRRQMQVKFVGANQIQIVRQEVPAGTTVLSTVDIEGGVEYAQAYGVPDTPDGFGNSSAVSFGTAEKILFNSDGTLIDQGGNPLNGTVFTAIPSAARSARAITILGGTGRIRGYRWDGRNWVLV